ncbi:MAG: hypothetical protein MJ231_09235 [bacterium]|nr:hypothetical protein [bacterium]
MNKKISFIESDTELIKDIQEYQEKHGLPYFVSAVRQLCKVALQTEKIAH